MFATNEELEGTRIPDEDDRELIEEEEEENDEDTIDPDNPPEGVVE